MATFTAGRVLGDINDGAVTLHADGSMTIPSDITYSTLYRDTVHAMIGGRLAAHNPDSGDVSLTGRGRAAAAAEGVAL